MKERSNNVNVDPYSVYDVRGLLKNIVLADSKSFVEDANKRKDRAAEILKITWGSEIKPQTYISPSTAALCLRMVSYEALGYPALPRTFESEMQMLMGTGAHYLIASKFSSYLRGFKEYPFLTENPHMSGRMDYLFVNPVTQKWQIIDFKFVSSFFFRQIKREGLTPDLKINKLNYNPSIENRKQLLLYMWAESQAGKDIACGHLIYINRDSGTVKTALIPWEAREKYDAEQFVVQVEAAKTNIQKGELAEPSVEKSYICGKVCLYRSFCEYGQKFAAGEIKKAAKRRPKYVIHKAIEERAAKIRYQESLGIIQPQLFNDELFPSDMENTLTRGIMEFTGGEALARTGGNIYRSSPEGKPKADKLKTNEPQSDFKPQSIPLELPEQAAIVPDKREKIFVQPDDVIKPDVYIRGTQQIDKVCFDCSAKMTRTVFLIKTHIRGTHRISVDENCPHCGPISHNEITVGAQQYLED